MCYYAMHITARLIRKAFTSIGQGFPKNIID